MKNPWKLIALLAGIFVLGATTGTLVTMRMLRQPPPAPRPPPAAEVWSAKHVKRLVDELGVTPDQLEKIRPIVDRRMLELFNLRARFLDNNHALREVMEREVAEFLTPEQRAKYEQMNREYHERTRRQERGERPPPPPERK
jgi:Spy/CpxP family protein refolding chaperone